MRRGADSDDVIRSRVEVIAQFAGGAHPANDGAHRLGWWLAEQISVDRAIHALCISIGVSKAWIERLLLGEIEPDGMIPRLIAEHCGGAVLPGDWGRGGPQCWMDRPFERVR